MAADEASTKWVPVCCGRVMRCNMFRQTGGGSYAALVCTVCNKNITLEQESLATANNFDSIAVLPFENVSRDPEHEYLSD